MAKVRGLPSNIYRTPIKKRTSIVQSPTSRPKNKSKRKQYVRSRGQGKPWKLKTY